MDFGQGPTDLGSCCTLDYQAANPQGHLLRFYTAQVMDRSLDMDVDADRRQCR